MRQLTWLAAWKALWRIQRQEVEFSMPNGRESWIYYNVCPSSYLLLTVGRVNSGECNLSFDKGKNKSHLPNRISIIQQQVLTQSTFSPGATIQKPKIIPHKGPHPKRQHSWLQNPPMGQSNENTTVLFHVRGGLWEDTGTEDHQHTGYLKRQTRTIPFHLLQIECSPTFDWVHKSRLGAPGIRGKKD